MDRAGQGQAWHGVDPLVQPAHEADSADQTTKGFTRRESRRPPSTSLTTSISGRREDSDTPRSRSNAAASSMPSCIITMALARSILARCSNATCNCSASRP